jgi:pimeloyl-ACP methyl ester carboxylesterase
VILETPDGRTLTVHDAGDPEGQPVIFHHGTPSVGEAYGPWLEAGVRLIGFDRAGYGGSTRDRGRDVAAVVADTRVVADALGLERFATWGISGGGPHALACAALLPERVTAAAALGSPAPYDADGLVWTDGLGEGNVIEYRAAMHGETALRALVEQEHAARVAAGAAALADAWASLLTPIDAELAAGPFSDYFHGLIRATGGVDGWVDDDLAFVRPWGFDPAVVDIPVLVRHGEQDRFVPPAHSRWLGEHIPGAEVRITSSDGHLTLYEHAIPETHAWLLGHRSDGSRS